MSEPPLPQPDRAQLLESLRRDARREAEETLARARAQAGDLREKTSRFIGQLKEEERVKTEREAAPELARIRNRANLESARAVLESEREIVEAVFAQAERDLSSPGASAALRRAFPRLLEEALEGLPPGAAARITVHPDDRAQAEKLLAARKLPVRLETTPGVMGGALVEPEGSPHIWDNTVKSRLEGLKARPPVELLMAFFPADPAPP